MYPNDRIQTIHKFISVANRTEVTMDFALNKTKGSKAQQQQQQQNTNMLNTTLHVCISTHSAEG